MLLAVLALAHLDAYVTWVVLWLTLVASAR